MVSFFPDLLIIMDSVSISTPSCLLYKFKYLNKPTPPDVNNGIKYLKYIALSGPDFENSINLLDSPAVEERVLSHILNNHFLTARLPVIEGNDRENMGPCNIVNKNHTPCILTIPFDNVDYNYTKTLGSIMGADIVIISFKYMNELYLAMFHAKIQNTLVRFQVGEQSATVSFKDTSDVESTTDLFKLMKTTKTYVNGFNLIPATVPNADEYEASESDDDCEYDNEIDTELHSNVPETLMELEKRRLQIDICHSGNSASVTFCNYDRRTPIKFHLREYKLNFTFLLMKRAKEPTKNHFIDSVTECGIEVFPLKRNFL